MSAPFARTICAVLAALLLTFAAATFVSAHSKPVKATINPNAVLTKSPDKLSITLNEETSKTGSKLTVTDASGKSVDKGDAAVDFNDPKVLSVSLNSNLPDGTYTVSYTTLTEDDNGLVNGKYAFKIAAAGPAAAGDTAASAFNPTEAPEAAPATGAGGGKAAQTTSLFAPVALALAAVLVLVVGGVVVLRRRRV